MGDGLTPGETGNLLALLCGLAAGLGGWRGGAAQTVAWLERRLGQSGTLRLTALLTALLVAGVAGGVGAVVEARSVQGPEGWPARWPACGLLVAGGMLAAWPAQVRLPVEPTRSLFAAGLVLAWHHARAGEVIWVAGLAAAGAAPPMLILGFAAGWSAVAFSRQGGGQGVTGTPREWRVAGAAMLTAAFGAAVLANLFAPAPASLVGTVPAPLSFLLMPTLYGELAHG